MMKTIEEIIKGSIEYLKNNLVKKDGLYIVKIDKEKEHPVNLFERYINSLDGKIKNCHIEINFPRKMYWYLLGDRFKDGIKNGKRYIFYDKPSRKPSPWYLKENIDGNIDEIVNGFMKEYGEEFN